MISSYPIDGWFPFSYYVGGRVGRIYKRDYKGGPMWNVWFVKHLPPADGLEWAASYSVQTYSSALIERLLTVRTEWSRK